MINRQEQQEQLRFDSWLDDLNRYKYNFFLTIRQQVLKQVKDAKIDVKIKQLRITKAARSLCILIKLSKKVRFLTDNLKKGRELMILNNRKLLSRRRISKHFREAMQAQYPKCSTIAERDFRRYIIPSFKFLYQSLGKE